MTLVTNMLHNTEVTPRNAMIIGLYKCTSCIELAENAFFVDLKLLITDEIANHDAAMCYNSISFCRVCYDILTVHRR